MRERPFIVDYLRWKNRRFGYKVTVQGTTNYRGPKGYYTVVTLVRDKTLRRMRVSADTLIASFRPIRSSRISRKSKYSILQEDPFS